MADHFSSRIASLSNVQGIPGSRADEFNPPRFVDSGSRLGAKMELERENFEAWKGVRENWDSLEILEIVWKERYFANNQFLKKRQVSQKFIVIVKNVYPFRNEIFILYMNISKFYYQSSILGEKNDHQRRERRVAVVKVGDERSGECLTYPMSWQRSVFFSFS